MSTLNNPVFAEPGKFHEYDTQVVAKVDPPHKVTWRQILSQVVVPFLTIRFVLVLIGVVVFYYIVPLLSVDQSIHPVQEYGEESFMFPNMFWYMWNRFDSYYYLDIAINGYDGPESLVTRGNWSFFPLYPILIRLFASPFSLFSFSPETMFDIYSMVAIVVSNACALLACTYLYKLVVKELGQKAAGRSVMYLCLYPLSFYLSAMYTESLFLFLSMSSVYYARQRKWWLAGLLGGLTALTRPQGVLLVGVIAWEYWQYLADRFAPLAQVRGILALCREWFRSRFLGLWRSLASPKTWLGFVCLLQVPLGFVLFCLYAQWMVGSFFAFQTIQKEGWGRTVSAPWDLLITTILNPVPPDPYDWNFYVLNLLVVAVFFLALLPIFRKLPSVYGIFSLLFWLLPLSSGMINSIARYYIEIFPAFIILAWWTSQEKEGEKRHHVALATLALLLGLGMVFWVLGIYSIA